MPDVIATDGKDADLTCDSMNLAVVLQDVGGSDQVQHTVDDQLAVASKLVALPLKKRDLLLLLLFLLLLVFLLPLTLIWVEQNRKRQTTSWEIPQKCSGI